MVVASSPIFLSIVIPAFNEAARLPASLAELIAYLRAQDYSWEILVVDDHSQDDTLAVLTPFQEIVRVLSNDHNSGKGFAIRRGVLASQGEAVAFTDADLSTPLEEIGTLLSWRRKGYDVVIGSRALSDSVIITHQPWHREWLGQMFNRLVRALLLKGIYDTQCGFKLFSRRAADAIFPQQQITGFAFDVELLYLARKCGFTIAEVPVRWRDSVPSRVRPFSHGARMLFDLWRIIRFERQGLYQKARSDARSHCS